jgi:hypothetical protein
VQEPVIRESETAILVAIDREEVWIPKSQIHDESEIKGDGQTGTLIVNWWFAD